MSPADVMATCSPPMLVIGRGAVGRLGSGRFPKRFAVLGIESEETSPRENDTVSDEDGGRAEAFLVLSGLDDPDPLGISRQVVAGAEPHGIDVEDQAAVAGWGGCGLLALAATSPHELFGEISRKIPASLVEEIFFPEHLSIGEAQTDEAALFGGGEDFVSDDNRR